MDWLRVFASFSCSRSLEAMADDLQHLVSTQLSDSELYLSDNVSRLTIAACSPGEYLLRGEVESFAALQAKVLADLLQHTEALQLDLFEEDGRLVKRLLYP